MVRLLLRKIPAVLLDGKSYVRLQTLIELYQDNIAEVTGESAERYSIEWRPELKQLRIDIEITHPLS